MFVFSLRHSQKKTPLKPDFSNVLGEGKSPEIALWDMEFVGGYGVLGFFRCKESKDYASSM